MGRVFGSVVLVAFGIGAFVIAHRLRSEARAHLALYESGERADGTIIDLRTRHRRRSDDYYVTYRFGVRGAEREIHQSDFALLKKGQTIAVWHDETRFTSEPERGAWNSQATWLALFYVGAGVFLLVVAAGVLRSRATS